MIIQGIVLNAGKITVSDALIGLSTSFPSGFLVGDMADFTLDPDATGPMGNIVYSGPSQDIAATLIAVDTIRFICSLPEGVGPFTMGNLVMYMQTDEETVPFVAVAFPQQIVKTPSADQVSTDGTIVPGSRFAISIEIKHSNTIDNVTITILPPDYSSLPTYATEADVPPAASSTFKQYVVSHDSRTGTPVMYSIDHNNVRWGNPFYQQISDPSFGQLHGGRDGEGWGGEADEIVFGHWYSTDNDMYAENPVGGASYTDDDTVLRTIGGATYTKTTSISPWEDS